MSNATATPIPVRADDFYTAQDLGIDTLATFEVNITEDEGERFATIAFVDPLEFHRERSPEVLDALTDEDGYLTSAIDAEMVVVIEDEMKRQGLTSEQIKAAGVARDSGTEWDDPSFAFSARFALPVGATLNTVSEIVWPFAAAMLNVTDPGTFGSRYLFDAASEEFMRNHEG